MSRVIFNKGFLDLRKLSKGKDYGCPKCGWINEEDTALLLIAGLNYRMGSNLDGEWSAWDEVIVCGKCHTLYAIENGSP